MRWITNTTKARADQIALEHNNQLWSDKSLYRWVVKDPQATTNPKRSVAVLKKQGLVGVYELDETDPQPHPIEEFAAFVRQTRENPPAETPEQKGAEKT